MGLALMDKQDLKPVDKKRLEKLYGDSSYAMAAKEPHAREVYEASGEALRLLKVMEAIHGELGSHTGSLTKNVENVAEMAIKVLGRWEEPEES